MQKHLKTKYILMILMQYFHWCKVHTAGKKKQWKGRHRNDTKLIDFNFFF